MSAPARRHLLAAAALLACSSWACAQSEMLPGTSLQLAPELRPPSALDPRAPLPLVLFADRIQGRPDLDASADGHVELRRGGTVVHADRLSYDTPTDFAKASGHVRISRNGNVFSGPELQLHVQRFEGTFSQPDYFIALTQAGGHADRIDFLDVNRSQAINATYTSCTRDGSGQPEWLLSTDRVTMDFATNTGVAEGAVVRFYAVPILAAPVLSFPLTDARKSGWLPPTVVPVDSRNGPTFGIGYYWNIAPDRDATFTPQVMTRRGGALDTEFRYLEPAYRGRIDLNLIPHDALAGQERHALQFEHEGDLPRALIHYRADMVRVSDDAYWKDFSRAMPSLTPRLLPGDLRGERRFETPAGDWTLYGRVQHWQVLNEANPDAPIAPPYDRLPQFGLRGSGAFAKDGSGPHYSLETEVNRFRLGDQQVGTSSVRPTEGTRAHLVGGLSWPLTLPGGWFTPRLAVNAADYRYRYASVPLGGADLDGRAHRVIPTFSVDSGVVFERASHWFGHDMRQTLEPRLLFVDTPYHPQSGLPNFDAAGKDFNDISVYSDNAFSGVDRVSDGRQLTMGVTTRWLDARTGAEAMRLGLVQRTLLTPQQITPAPEGGTTVEGEPNTRRFSDVLLLGSSTIWPHWTTSATVQYSPEIHRPIRSIAGIRYSPGDFRTINFNYRFARGSSEQLELGWQWPIYGPARDHKTIAPGSCGGSWYSVGRVNYSKPDRRVTDSIVGFEYDAGCWIGRVVAERVSTGVSEATTRVMFQLELVGLSRLGSNPLQVLKDNIPGYRLLRDTRAGPTATATYD